MSERAMILLMEEWYRQLCDGLETAKAALPDPEPEQVRVWKPGVLFFMRMPTEADPPEQWELIVRDRTPPMLCDLEAAIDRIGEHMGRLRGDGNA